MEREWAGPKIFLKFNQNKIKTLFTSNSIRNLRHLLTQCMMALIYTPGPFPLGPRPTTVTQGSWRTPRSNWAKSAQSRGGIIDTVIRETRASIIAHIKLVTMDPAAYTDGEASFVRMFMAQACAKEKGPCRQCDSSSCNLV